jgi:hypothetical protein
MLVNRTQMLSVVDHDLFQYNEIVPPQPKLRPELQKSCGHTGITCMEGLP